MIDAASGCSLPRFRQQGQPVVAEIGEQDANGDRELKETHQPSAQVRWRSLGDIERADHRGNAHSDAADPTEGDEAGKRPGHAATHRRQEQQQR